MEHLPPPRSPSTYSKQERTNTSNTSNGIDKYTPTGYR
jgi:hypothetical protein